MTMRLTVTTNRGAVLSERTYTNDGEAKAGCAVALARHPDCEVRLATSPGDVGVSWAAPRRTVDG